MITDRHMSIQYIWTPVERAITIRTMKFPDVAMFLQGIINICQVVVKPSMTVGPRKKRSTLTM